jgi:outer membrane lipoprotein-sorting protein
MNVKSLFLIILFSFGALGLQAQDALTIVEKLDANLAKIKDKSVDIEMTMSNLKTGKSKVKKAELLQKGETKKLFRYTFPESDAGIATLTLPNDEIYLYLPMFKKPKKITNMAESNAFNKSDFSLDDMASSDFAEKYSAGLMTYEGDAFKVMLTPKDAKSPYSKLVMYINKSQYTTEKIEYYVKTEMQKFALYNYRKVSDVWVADEVSMEDVKKQHKTTLKMTNIKINQGLDDSLFALESLAPTK